MSLNKQPLVTVTPAVPAALAQLFSRTCPVAPPPGAPTSGSTTVVSSYIETVYGYIPPNGLTVLQYYVCYVFADGRTQCNLIGTLN